MIKVESYIICLPSLPVMSGSPWPLSTITSGSSTNTVPLLFSTWTQNISKPEKYLVEEKIIVETKIFHPHYLNVQVDCSPEHRGRAQADPGEHGHGLRMRGAGVCPDRHAHHAARVAGAGLARHRHDVLRDARRGLRPLDPVPPLPPHPPSLQHQENIINWC